MVSQASGGPSVFRHVKDNGFICSKALDVVRNAYASQFDRTPAPASVQLLSRPPAQKESQRAKRSRLTTANVLRGRRYTDPWLKQNDTIWLQHGVRAVPFWYHWVPARRDAIE